MCVQTPWKIVQNFGRNWVDNLKVKRRVWSRKLQHIFPEEMVFVGTWSEGRIPNISSEEWSIQSIGNQNLSRQMLLLTGSVTIVRIHLYECLCRARKYSLEMTFFVTICFHGCLETLLLKNFHYSALVTKVKTKWSNWQNSGSLLDVLACEMFFVCWLLAVVGCGIFNGWSSREKVSHCVWALRLQKLAQHLATLCFFTANALWPATLLLWRPWYTAPSLNCQPK